MKLSPRHLIAAALCLLPMILVAQNRQKKQEQKDQDKYVRLMSAQSVRMLEIDGKPFRKAEGPARFLHNNTWLICDTALWDVNEQVIHATGHVSIEQENTELTSDNMVYHVESNLAEFRGGLVQLRDKDNNTLRTTYLDYNTKDSVALFRYGGAMRDKDGQLIESTDGTYESKAKSFTFTHNVNMFTDSVFVKTSKLIYTSDNSTATFPNYVESWKDDKMMAGDTGWYDRSRELFHFNGNVHLMSSTQEGWCDSLYYERGQNNVRMLGRAQVTDEERAVTSMAGAMDYVDSTSLLTLRRNPVVIIETEEKDRNNVAVKDSVYMSADTIFYWTVKRYMVDSALVEQAAKRLEEISDDPVANVRKKAAEEAEKKRKEAEEAAANDPTNPNYKPKEAEDGSKEAEKADKVPSQPVEEADDSEEKSEKRKRGMRGGGMMDRPDSLATADSLAVTDSLATADTPAAADSLAVTDSLAAAEPLDTTKIGFLRAGGKVRLFRKKMQMTCDSLLYSDLDSLARLFKDPLVWNEGNHQYQADSIYLVILDNAVNRANLFSNAFIHIEEEPGKFYDQIKGAEMTAFFDSDSQLRRFDAMGDAGALFYIKEKEAIATANRKEAKILTADFKDGEITQITYYESPKSDVYPVAQMTAADKSLRGFSWRPELRPASPQDITTKTPRASERNFFNKRERARFDQTERYFKGYMAKIYREIARSDSLRRARAMEKPDTSSERLAGSDTSAVFIRKRDGSTLDSLHIRTREADSTAIADSSAKTVQDSTVAAIADTTARFASDSTAVVSDTTATVVKTAAQIREEKRQARIKAREDRWAALDARDAMKQAANDAKKRERKEKKEAKIRQRKAEQKAKDDALREKYKQKYLKKLWTQKPKRSTATGSGEPSLP